MIQQIADTLRHDRTYAGEPLRKNVGPNQHHAPYN